MEDTAFYRWTHLTSLTEVGGNPAGFALSADEAHAWADRVQNIWPDTMVTSTTHDTKRGEDVRARLDVLASYAEEWSDLIHRLRAMTAQVRPWTSTGAARTCCGRPCGGPGRPTATTP